MKKKLRSFCIILTAIVICISANPVLSQLPPFGDFPRSPRVPPNLQSGPLRTITIASIGESYAAGEGNPDQEMSWIRFPDIPRAGAKPMWSAENGLQCHHSLNNGRALAAKQLSEVQRTRVVNRRIITEPAYSVKFKSFACSGATINQGLLGPYGGIAYRSQVFPAVDLQIQQVKEWLDSDPSIEQLDVLIISVGGNDVGFAKVVASCLTPGNCATDSELWSSVSRGDPQLTTEFIGLRNLSNAYNRLNERIRREINPRHIIITEYPDPTKNEFGAFCNRFDDSFLVTPERLLSGEVRPTTGILRFLSIGGSMKELESFELSIIFTGLLTPLNAIIQGAAQRLGWEYVGGMMELSKEHGFCAEDPWFNTLEDSWRVQSDLVGTAHPNIKGHNAYKNVISNKIVQILGLPIAPAPEFIDYRLYEYLGRNNWRLLGTIDEPGIERSVVGQRKRVRFEVAPTTQPVNRVELEFSVRRRDSQAMTETTVVQATRDMSFRNRQVYIAEIPGIEDLRTCDWMHIRGRLRYSISGLTYGPTRTIRVSDIPGQGRGLCDSIPR